MNNLLKLYLKYILPPFFHNKEIIAQYLSSKDCDIIFLRIKGKLKYLDTVPEYLTHYYDEKLDNTLVFLKLSEKASEFLKTGKTEEEIDKEDFIIYNLVNYQENISEEMYKLMLEKYFNINWKVHEFTRADIQLFPVTVDGRSFLNGEFFNYEEKNIQKPEDLRVGQVDKTTEGRTG